MTMFGVKAGTKVKMVRAGVEWHLPQAMREYVTKWFTVFDVADLIVDPTGIGKGACGPTDRVIGGEYAKKGWYGFRVEGSPRWYAVMVPASEVEVN